MRLQHLTFAEAAAALARCSMVIVPVGSTEQHGPNGLLGTDALCAEAIAVKAGERAQILVAPTLAYGPAQFNLGFPGTVSVRSRTLMTFVEDIVASLHRQGIRGAYFLNGHGANVASLNCAMHDLYDRFGDDSTAIRVRNWWDFEAVNAIRKASFGVWEGLHATPSEISLTQHCHRVVDVALPPRTAEPLDTAFLAERAGDRHPPAGRHRKEFPDGRVGSDSSLASPEIGRQLLEAAAEAVEADALAFSESIGACCRSEKIPPRWSG